MPTFLTISNDRKNNLDFLRLLFAGVVIFSHSFYLLGAGGDTFAQVSHGQMHAGRIAVQFFFVISGFLVTRSWLSSQGLLDYLRKRALRIYPGFIAASTVCVFFVGALGAASTSRYLADLDLLHLGLGALTLVHLPILPTLLSNPVPGELNGSLWTIRIEFECYLLVAILGLLRLYRTPVPLALFLVLFARYTLQGMIPMPAVLNRVADNMDLATFFLAGMVFFLYRCHVPYQRRLFLGALAVIALTSQIGGLPPAMVIAGTYAVFYAAFNTSVRLHRIASRADLSYGVYLYGWPVQQLLVQHLLDLLNPLVLFVTAFVGACGLAALSWQFVEKPALRLKSARARITSPNAGEVAQDLRAGHGRAGDEREAPYPFPSGVVAEGSSHQQAHRVV